MNFESLGKIIRKSFLSDLKKIGLAKTFKVPINYLIGKGRFFGDYYSIYLSEIVGLKDKSLIQKLGNAFLFGRTFVIAQDQVLDNPQNFNPEYVLISSVLYDEFISKTTSLIDDPVFKRNMYRVLQEAREANIFEQKNHRNKISPFTIKDLKNLGRKTGLVKIPAEAFSYLVNKRELAEKIKSISDNILISIQICDDLADVVDDFKSGNYTIPVTHSLILSSRKFQTEEAIYEGLFSGGLFESLLSYSLHLLKHTKSEIRSIAHNETQAEIYVSQLIMHLSRILEKYKKSKKNLSIKIYEEQDFTKLKPLTKFSKKVDSLKKYLKELEPAKIAPNVLNGHKDIIGTILK